MSDDEVPVETRPGTEQGPGGGARNAGERPAGQATPDVTPAAPRGVDPNFDANALVPVHTTKDKLDALKEQRAALAANKRNLTKELRKVKKAKERLKSKASSLSQDDLCQIIAIKQDLSEQWKRKHAQTTEAVTQQNGQTTD